MEVSTRHYGGHADEPAGILEITIISNTSTVKEDVTNLNGSVDAQFIADLKEIVEELEHQNERVKLKNKNNEKT